MAIPESQTFPIDLLPLMCYNLTKISSAVPYTFRRRLALAGKTKMEKKKPLIPSSVFPQNHQMIQPKEGEVVIGIIIQKEYEKTPWCHQITDGLFAAVKQKRLPSQIVSSVSGKNSIGEFCVIVGSDPVWQQSCAIEALHKNSRPIVLGSQGADRNGCAISYVGGDISESVQSAISYLHSAGAENLALYGVNPDSSTDLERSAAYLQYGGEPEHIFNNCGCLEECFRHFAKRDFPCDAVICTNDFAAVSLIRALQKQRSPLPLILSYSDTVLARLFSPSVTSLSLDYRELGKTAVTVCEMIRKNPGISSLIVRVSWKIHPRQTTGGFVRSVSAIPSLSLPLSPQNTDFYQDAQLSEMMNLEKMLCQCDEVDFRVLELILAGKAVSQMVEESFLSESGLKYRIRRLSELCGCTDRKQLAERVGRYLSAPLSASGSETAFPNRGRQT